jgi:F0F1-type ATP synthase assembly protein I
MAIERTLCKNARSFKGGFFRASRPGVTMADNGRSPMRGLGYGLEVGVGMGLGTVVGLWWDRHHGSEPWGLLIGLFVGGAAGMYLLIRDAMKMNKE